MGVCRLDASDLKRLFRLNRLKHNRMIKSLPLVRYNKTNDDENANPENTKQRRNNIRNNDALNKFTSSDAFINWKGKVINSKY